MKKSTHPKMKLHRETLRNLTEPELQMADGGAALPSTTTTSTTTTTTTFSPITITTVTTISTFFPAAPQGPIAF